MQEREIECQRGAQFLLRWLESRHSALYAFTCPSCATLYEVLATPPIAIHLPDGNGSWIQIATIQANPSGPYARVLAETRRAARCPLFTVDTIPRLSQKNYWTQRKPTCTLHNG